MAPVPSRHKKAKKRWDIFCHTLEYHLTKFHFDTTCDSKQTIDSVTSYL